jgi:hypothetical protein
MPRKNRPRKSKHEIALIRQRAETGSQQMTRLMILNGSAKRWLDMEESQTDLFILVFNRVDGLRAAHGPSFHWFLTQYQRAAFSKFRAFCENLDNKEQDNMSARGISLDEFQDGYLGQAEGDYQVLMDYGNRLNEAKELNQHERVQYLLRGIQQVHRVVFAFRPDKPDAIDRELDRLASFFNDNE